MSNRTINLPSFLIYQRLIRLYSARGSRSDDDSVSSYNITSIYTYIVHFQTGFSFFQTSWPKLAYVISILIYCAHVMLSIQYLLFLLFLWGNTSLFIIYIVKNWSSAYYKSNGFHVCCFQILLDILLFCLKFHYVI